MDEKSYRLLQDGDLVRLNSGGPIGTCCAFIDGKAGSPGQVQFLYTDNTGTIKTITVVYTALTAESGKAFELKIKPGCVNPGSSVSAIRPGTRPITRPVASRLNDQ